MAGSTMAGSVCCPEAFEASELTGMPVGTGGEIVAEETTLCSFSQTAFTFVLSDRSCDDSDILAYSGIEASSRRS